MIVHAMQALGRGFHVFPVQPREKTPHLIITGRPWTIRWSEVATNNTAQVHAWWTASPQANIGIACKQSGLFILDCDVAKEAYACRNTPYEYLHDTYGPYLDGMDVLREVCRKYGQSLEVLLDTYCVQTGSLGLHIYLRWPPEIKASQSSIVKGVLDVRGNGGPKGGGYVLGAGSVTEKGPYVVENDAPVRDAPRWIVDLCKEKVREKGSKSLFRQPGGDCRGLIDSVRNAHEGNRSNVLYWAALAMWEDSEPVEKALELLLPAALECGLSESEAMRTVHSAFGRY